MSKENPVKEVLCNYVMKVKGRGTVVSSHLPFEEVFKEKTSLKEFQELMNGSIYTSKEDQWSLKLVEVGRCLCTDPGGFFYFICTPIGDTKRDPEAYGRLTLVSQPKHN